MWINFYVNSVTNICIGCEINHIFLRKRYRLQCMRDLTQDFWSNESFITFKNCCFISKIFDILLIESKFFSKNNWKQFLRENFYVKWIYFHFHQFIELNKISIYLRRISFSMENKMFFSVHHFLDIHEFTIGFSEFAYMRGYDLA